MQNLKRFFAFGAALFILLAPGLAAHTASAHVTGTPHEEPSSTDSTPTDTYYRAEVILVEKLDKEIDGAPAPWQATTVNILSGDEKGKITTIEDEKTLTEGELVTIHKIQTLGVVTYSIVGPYRIPPLTHLAVALVGFAVTLSTTYLFRSKTPAHHAHEEN